MHVSVFHAGRTAALVLAACAFAAGFAPAASAADDHEPVRAAVARVAPGLPVSSIRPSPLPGVLEVQVGARVLYVAADGTHVLEGTLTETASGRDVTESSRSERRRQILADLPDSAKIRFAPDSPAQHVTVFTAVDCGYCRKFHNGIEGYLAEGIAIDYVMIPLAGPGSAADQASRDVYCADNRQAAFTAATAGQAVAAGTCDGPSGYPLAIATAAMLGIGRTPTIVSAKGEIVGGFLTPAQLRERLSR